MIISSELSADDFGMGLESVWLLSLIRTEEWKGLIDKLFGQTVILYSAWGKVPLHKSKIMLDRYTYLIIS